MTVEADSPSVQAAALELLDRVGVFLADLWAIPEVHAVGINSDPTELWVLLEHENVQVSKQILGEHWLRFERRPGPSVGIHVVPLDRVKRENLPHFRTIAER